MWLYPLSLCVCVCVSAVWGMQGQPWCCPVPSSEPGDVPADPLDAACWAERLPHQKVSVWIWGEWSQTKVCYFFLLWEMNLDHQQWRASVFALWYISLFLWQHDIIGLCSDWPTVHVDHRLQSNMELQNWGPRQVCAGGNSSFDSFLTFHKWMFCLSYWFSNTKCLKHLLKT